MTDQPGRDTGGDIQPAGGSGTGDTQERQLPVPRPATEVAPADRFTAPPSTHNTSLSPERAATIVRQSASARKSDAGSVWRCVVWPAKWRKRADVG